MWHFWDDFSNEVAYRPTVSDSPSEPSLLRWSWSSGGIIGPDMHQWIKSWASSMCDTLNMAINKWRTSLHIKPIFELSSRNNKSWQLRLQELSTTLLFWDPYSALCQCRLIVPTWLWMTSLSPAAVDPARAYRLQHPTWGREMMGAMKGTTRCKQVDGDLLATTRGDVLSAVWSMCMLFICEVWNMCWYF